MTTHCAILSECVPTSSYSLKSALLRCLLYLFCTNSPRDITFFQILELILIFVWVCLLCFFSCDNLWWSVATHTGHVRSQCECLWISLFKYIQIWARLPPGFATHARVQRQQSITRVWCRSANDWCHCRNYKRYLFCGEVQIWTAVNQWFQLPIFSWTAEMGVMALDINEVKIIHKAIQFVYPIRDPLIELLTPICLIPFFDVMCFSVSTLSNPCLMNNAVY